MFVGKDNVGIWATGKAQGMLGREGRRERGRSRLGSEATRYCGAGEGLIGEDWRGGDPGKFVTRFVDHYRGLLNNTLLTNNAVKKHINRWQAVGK